MEELHELEQNNTEDMRDWMLFHDGRAIGTTTKQVFFVEFGMLVEFGIAKKVKAGVIPVKEQKSTFMKSQKQLVEKCSRWFEALRKLLKNWADCEGIFGFNSIRFWYIYQLFQLFGVKPRHKDF
jgi:hypothetical protein